MNHVDIQPGTLAAQRANERPEKSTLSVKVFDDVNERYPNFNFNPPNAKQLQLARRAIAKMLDRLLANDVF